ncbi:hypothetical protein [Streptomyces cathayae]|uniref:Uncharacterized protein n=1 Tax=Streptomyces cathayae TaxID=3031124 RepID=A0ABY8KC40_9ACTN|nr:hypothetical protein [Streptomyces sp. HUAS 5]WGD43837.1 hypothetical protein PYS65_28930 [Streptomyces sp. HUAS 5]
MPRTPLDSLRTPRSLHGFLKNATLCAPIASLITPLSPADAAEAASLQVTEVNDLGKPNGGGPLSGPPPFLSLSSLSSL